jgi:hypothetical protein
VLRGGICSLDRIVERAARRDDAVMPPEVSRRPADNELYDRGCDLVEAAMAIRRLADDPGAARALPALLGCMETALHELGCAVASMDETSVRSLPTEAMADRMHRGFMNLGLALADAELASTAARGLAGRSLAAMPEAASFAARTPTRRPGRTIPRTGE